MRKRTKWTKLYRNAFIDCLVNRLFQGAFRVTPTRITRQAKVFKNLRQAAKDQKVCETYTLKQYILTPEAREFLRNQDEDTLWGLGGHVPP